MKAAFVILMLCLFPLNPLSCQQLPQNSQYMFSLFTFNPAQAGNTEYLYASLWHRRQWSGIEGAPLTTLVNVEMPLSLWGSRGGAGLSLSNDEAGFNRDINIMGTYAYHLPVAQGTLSLGLSIGLVHRALDAEWYIPGGGTGASGDPALPTGDESQSAIDMNFGVLYQAEKYFVGLSTVHLNEPTFSNETATDRLSRHYYITAGYTWQLNHPSWEIKPSFLWCSNGKTSSYTGNILAVYNKRMWGGVSYRRSDAVSVLLGLDLMGGLKIGYSYDFTISDMRSEAGGSHEFLIRYAFRVGRERSTFKYKSIRYL